MKTRTFFIHSAVICTLFVVSITNCSVFIRESELYGTWVNTNGSTLISSTPATTPTPSPTDPDNLKTKKLMFSSDHSIKYEYLINDTVNNTETSMVGTGTYSADGQYYSISINLTENTINNLSTIYLNGTYSVSGLCLSLKTTNTEELFYKTR